MEDAFLPLGERRAREIQPKTPEDIQAQFESHIRDCFRTRKLQFNLLNFPMGALYTWRALIFRAVQNGATSDEAYDLGMRYVRKNLWKANAATSGEKSVSFQVAEEIVHTTVTLALIIRNGGGTINYHSLPAEFLAD